MQTEYSLDDTQMRFLETRLNAMKQIENELNGALALLIEMQGLTGTWKLDLSSRRLIQTGTQLKAA